MWANPWISHTDWSNHGPPYLDADPESSSMKEQARWHFLKSTLLKKIQREPNMFSIMWLIIIITFLLSQGQGPLAQTTQLDYLVVLQLRYLSLKSCHQWNWTVSNLCFLFFLFLINVYWSVFPKFANLNGSIHSPIMTCLQVFSLCLLSLCLLSLCLSLSHSLSLSHTHTHTHMPIVNNH